MPCNAALETSYGAAAEMKLEESSRPYVRIAPSGSSDKGATGCFYKYQAW